MKSMIISSSTTKKNNVKSLKVMSRIADELQSKVELQNEGIHVCSKHVRIEGTISNLKNRIVCKPGTPCLIIVMKEEVYSEIEGLFQERCRNSQYRAEILNKCHMGTLSPKHEKEIFEYFEPVVLAVIENTLSTSAVLNSKQLELSYQKLDFASMNALAYRGMKMGMADFNRNMLFEAAEKGSIRAKVQLERQLLKSPNKGWSNMKFFIVDI